MASKTPREALAETPKQKTVQFYGKPNKVTTFNADTHTHYIHIVIENCTQLTTTKNDAQNH
jgi:hypothetical protein